MPKQLVVQEALLTLSHEFSYFSWFTPTTNMDVSVEGVEVVINTVNSTTYSVPAVPHLMLAGSHPCKMEIVFLLMTRFLFSVLTV